MAEKYKSDEPPVVGVVGVGTETERTTVTTRAGAENGAREYPIPKKKAFPWWLLLPLLLIPLIALLLSNRNKTETATGSTSGSIPSTPVAVTSPQATSPAVVAAASPEAEETSRSRMAAALAVPPPGPKGRRGKDIKVFKGSDITVAPKGGASAKGEPLTDVFAITGAKDRLVLVGRKAQLKNVHVTRVLNDQAFYVGTGANAEMLVLLDPKLDAGTSGGEKVVIAEGKTVSLTGLLEGPATSEQLTTYKINSEDAAAIGSQSVYLHATIAQDKG